MLLEIKTTDLWEQFKERHDPPAVKSLPATAEGLYFDQYLIDQDTHEEYRADRREAIEKYGQERWQVEDISQAAREANWIRVFESQGRRAGQRRAELTRAGYTFLEIE